MMTTRVTFYISYTILEIPFPMILYNLCFCANSLIIYVQQLLIVFFINQAQQNFPN